MAEWSKAVDLRPTIERCEGSNPSRRKENVYFQTWLAQFGRAHDF